MHDIEQHKNLEGMQPEDMLEHMVNVFKDIQPAYNNPEAAADMYRVIALTFASMFHNAGFYSNPDKQIKMWEQILREEHSSKDFPTASNEEVE